MERFVDQLANKITLQEDSEAKDYRDMGIGIAIIVSVSQYTWPTPPPISKAPPLFTVENDKNMPTPVSKRRLPR